MITLAIEQQRGIPLGISASVRILVSIPRGLADGYASLKQRFERLAPDIHVNLPQDISGHVFIEHQLDIAVLDRNHRLRDYLKSRKLNLGLRMRMTAIGHQKAEREERGRTGPRHSFSPEFSTAA